MSITVRRRLVDLACRILQAALPPSQQQWGLAIRCEAAEITDDTSALLFALDSVSSLLPRALASRVSHHCSAVIDRGVSPDAESTTSKIGDGVVLRPRAIGIACAICAVALGVAYMGIAGAPVRYLGTNIGAVAIGATLLALVGRTVRADASWRGSAIAAMACAVLATALLGSDVDGASRWVRLGALSVQPSLILLPLMIISFARCHDTPATAGMIVATAALALQPDRAMAGMLAATLAVMAIMRRDRHAITLFIVSSAGFATTLVREDTLSSAPYVAQVLRSSFHVHIAAGAAVMGGSVLLCVPAILGWRRDPANRETYAAFGTAWLAAILAAALGTYPTPLVGYGGSAIVGYALSLWALPPIAYRHAAAGSQDRRDADATTFDRQLLVSLA